MKLHKSEKLFVAERTVWNPTGKQRNHDNNPERKAIEDMEVGDVLKVVHPNYSCKGIGQPCSLLSSTRSWFLGEGRKFRSYHEDTNVAVIKRVKQMLPKDRYPVSYGWRLFKVILGMFCFTLLLFFFPLILLLALIGSSHPRDFWESMSKVYGKLWVALVEDNQTYIKEVQYL